MKAPGVYLLQTLILALGLARPIIAQDCCTANCQFSPYGCSTGPCDSCSCNNSGSGSVECCCVTGDLMICTTVGC